MEGQVCRAQDAEGQKFHGEEYQASNDAMQYALQEGSITVHRHVKMEMRVALMTESHMLYAGKSPYRHNRFPLTPMWCYRRHRDGLPYGVIRDVRDAQIDYNKRASKALYILSTVRVVYEDGAFEDPEATRQEIARPDGMIRVKAGRKVEIQQDKALAEEHLKLMVLDGQIIRDLGGVTDQNLGNAQDGMSGKAIGKLQDQGTLVTAALFDNMRLAIQIQSEIQLSLLEQFYTHPMVVRIVGENKPVEWLKINQYDEENRAYLNDITKSKADYVIGEQDFKQSTRQAMAESLADVISKMDGQVALALLDMLIDLWDVPNKDEMVARVRKINGQSDPSKEPTPEELQAKEQAEQEAQLAKQMQAEMMQAQIDKAKADAAKSEAQTGEIMAKIDKIIADTVNTTVTAFYQAMQAGQVVATVPGVTPIADGILKGAGYVDNGGQSPDLPAPQAPAPVVDPQQMQAQNAVAPETIPVQQEFPELQQADGAAAGIETLANDGTHPSLNP